MKKMFKKTSFLVIAISLIISLFVIFVMPYLSESFSSLSIRLLIALTIFFTTLIVVLLVILLRKQETKDRLKEKEKELRNYKIILQKKKIIREKFKEILRTIKNSSLYKNRTRAKYELPWYFILGNSNSGKTSLIRNSGLDLPLNIKDSNLTNTFNENETKEDDSFTWFYTENSIFVDIKGSFINQEVGSEDSILWKEFLKIFRRKRWKRPINGVILAISADTILSLQNGREDVYIKNLRDRFDEISSSFLSTIPIYLIITKSDVIDGFQEYFALLKENEKDEVFGVTFNSEEKVTKETIKPYFENLLKRLSSSVIEKMYFEWDEDNRWKIFSFCNKFCEVLERTDNFIEKCFSNTRYRTPLLLRGVYFTTALDSEYLKKIQEQNTLLDTNNTIQTKGMFIKKLFTDIIFSEADMIKLDEKYEKNIIKKHYISYILAMLLVILLGTFIIKDFLNQDSTLDNMARYYEKYIDDKENLLADSNYNNIVELLNSFENIEKINNAQTDSNFWNLSFFNSDDRVEKLQNRYHTDLVKFFLNEVSNSIEQNIKTQLDNFDTTWNNTKAYLMLQNLEKRDNEYLKDYMARYWNERYTNMPEFQRDLNRHWENTLKFRFNSYEINNDILELARDRLNEFNQAQLAYKVIKSDALRMNIKEFSFAEIINNNKNFFTNDDYIIPGLFTKEGFAIMMTKGLGLTSNALKNNWVVQKRTDLSALEIEEYYKEILKYYFNDYRNYWNNALSKLQVNYFITMVDLNNQLSLVTSPNSPILDVLKAVKENTELYTPLEMASQTSLLSKEEDKSAENKTAKVVAEVSKAVNSKLNIKDIILLRAFFKPYHDLLDKNYQPSYILKNVNDRVNNTYQIMTTIKEAITPNEGSFKILQNRVQGQEKSMFASFNTLPTYTKNWYENILQANWEYLLGKAKIYVNEKYQENVYDFYSSRLKGKYPFSKTKNYVNLDDFEEFFKSDGLLDNFYKNYLSVFLTINKNNFHIKYRNLDGNSITVNKNMEHSLKIAYEIRRAFFKNDGTFSLEVIIKPHTLSSNLATTVLEYGDISLSYEHGPQISKELVWPQEDSNILKFKLFDLNNSLIEEQFINSDWALFELMDNFKHKKYKQEKIYIYKKDDYEVSFLIEGYINNMLDKRSGLSEFILGENL